MSATALTPAQRGFVLGSEPANIEGAEDRRRFLDAMRDDQRRIARGQQPGKSDAVPSRMCTRCGMNGRHATPTDCIDALRSRVADLTGK